MEPVTAAEVRVWSKVDFDSLTYADDADLQVLIDRASAGVMNITGRTLETMPSELDVIAQEAIQLQTETLAYQAQPDYIETLADFDLLSSFSAGSYSEQRRSVEEAIRAKALATNPKLHALLMGLMTKDKLDAWLALLNNQIEPYIVFAEIDPSLDASYSYPDPFA